MKSRSGNHRISIGLRAWKFPYKHRWLLYLQRYRTTNRRQRDPHVGRFFPFWWCLWWGVPFFSCSLYFLSENGDEKRNCIVVYNSTKKTTLEKRWSIKVKEQLPKTHVLQLQNGRCPDCLHQLLPGGMRWCHYTQRYFCFQCHKNDRRPIPASVVERWDFVFKNLFFTTTTT